MVDTWLKRVCAAQYDYQLDEEDKSTVFKIIDTMLTKNKFKDFFNKNVAAL